MNTPYRDLGIYSDIAEYALRKTRPPAPIASMPKGHIVREVLGFADHPEDPQDVVKERTWSDGDLSCEELSWSVGYGPRTRAWLFLPAGGQAPLPGVVALHCHSGYKYYGKEKIAKGPDETECDMGPFWRHYYGGRPFANALAREGFAVLVPDTFTWGSRKFPIETMGERIRSITDATAPMWADWMQKDRGMTFEAATYNAASGHHESVVEKYCNLLGTTFAGIVSHEDRIAVNYLRSRSEVDPARIGSVGLSGGGCRSGLLQATSDDIRAAVVVGMMSTYAELLDHNVSTHTFMLFPGGWPRHGDWPDLVASRAPSPLLVQYDLEDSLFPESGMRKADQLLKTRYEEAGEPGAYRGEFYPGPHKFDVEMQTSAFAWLRRHLAPR
jgi:dienelactone hydrolase